MWWNKKPPKQKIYKLSADQIQPIYTNAGGCLATDRITVDGAPVGWMYRVEANNPLDNGWRFFAGDEDDAYVNTTSNSGVYDINTIVNYDPLILPYLDAPVGSAFERTSDGDFKQVAGWLPP